MKKYFIVIVSVVLPVAALAIWGFVSLQQEKHNGFNRNFKEGMVVFKGEVTAVENLIAVNGISSTTTYFTSQDPQRPAKLKHEDTHITYDFLNITVDQWIKYNFSVQIDSSYITVFAGNLPGIFRKEFGESKATTKLPIQSKHFTTALQYAPQRYFIRVYSKEDKDYIVAKVNASGQVEGYEKHVSYLTHDNGMSSQAHMIYNPEHQRLFLIQKMSNQIRCLDTNMNLAYAASTIDTFTTANVKEVIKNEKNGKVGTQSAPPRYTNYAVALSKDYLYSYSKIRADNQIGKPRLITLDIYAVVDGSYQYSITLPNTEKQNLVDFKIYGNRLVALIGNGRRIMNYEIKEQKSGPIVQLL